MGEKYKATLEKKIREFGGENLRVFINAEGVNPLCGDELTLHLRTEVYVTRAR